jgi:hypothetical protein
VPPIRLSGRKLKTNTKPKPKPAVQSTNGAVNGQPKPRPRSKESFDYYRSTRHPVPAQVCQCDNPLVFAHELTGWDQDDAHCQRCGKRV